MTLLAVGKIVIAECTFVVMAGSAALCIPGRTVKDHPRCRHLVSAGTRTQRMARTAAHPFVPGVAEAPDVVGRDVNGPGAARFVAGRA